MPKMTPHEIQSIVDSFKSAEQKCPKIRHPDLGYVPSRAVEVMQGPEFRNQLNCVKAVKHCLNEKGKPFDEVFRKAHAVIYLITRKGETYERAMKRYRLLLDKVRDPERSLEKTMFLSFVKDEHKVLFKDS